MEESGLPQVIADKDKALEEARVRAANLEIERDEAVTKLKRLQAVHHKRITESEEYKELLAASQEQEEKIKTFGDLMSKQLPKASDLLPAEKELWVDPARAKSLFVRLRVILDHKEKGYLQYDGGSGEVLDILPEAAK